MKTNEMKWMCAAKIEAAQSEDGEAKVPTIEIEAYTGAAIDVGYWGHSVIDLESFQGGTVQLLADHVNAVDYAIGHGEAVVQNGSIVVNGQLSGANQRTREIIEAAKNGLPWQASIGTSSFSYEEFDAGDEVTVNGVAHAGPITVFRNVKLSETSILPLGADGRTSAEVAARKAQEEETMSEKETKALEAAPAPVQEVDVQAERDDAIKAERQRIADVEAACAGVEVENVEEIKAEAIRSGASVEEVNASLIKAVKESRPAPKVVVAETQDDALSTDTLQAAIDMQFRQADKVAADYGVEATSKAQDHFAGLTLSELAHHAAAIQGKTLPMASRKSGEWMRAAFSAIDMSGILGNTLRKVMLDSYQAVPITATTVAYNRSVADFKQYTAYRMNGDFELLKVAADGELKHADATEASQTIKADTYGRLFSITRQDMINDDLGAFMMVAQKFGRGAALALERAFYTLVNGGETSGFYAAGNSNLNTGTDTALSISALQTALTALETQTDPEGNPINVTGAYLLTPSALKVTGLSIFNETRVNETTTANKKSTADNPFAGAFTPISTPWLSNSAITGYSAAAWYLLANPMDLAAYEIAWLNGVQSPTVEEVATPSDRLGITWRAYMDFGVGEGDYRAIQKSTGEAAGS